MLDLSSCGFWHQRYSQQCRQTEDQRTLRLGIAVNPISLSGGKILEQAIEQINRFPDSAGNEV